MAIIGFSHSTIIDLLEASPYEFYLCGSRRMAQKEAEQQGIVRQVLINSDTDYDFFVTHSDNVLAFLLDNGFTHTESSLGALQGFSNYLDDEAVAVVTRDNVQVVLRKDATFYRHVFESISVDFYCKYLWKSSPHHDVKCEDIQPIMNQLFATAHGFHHALPIPIVRA
jgi:hypothetical protein